MNIFMQDVLNQVSHVEKALDSYFSSDFSDTLDKISKLNYSKIIFTGMGSSHYACIGASLFLNEKKVDSMVISTGQLLYYGLNIVDDQTLLIIVSQSGESAEIKNLLSKLDNKENVVGITNHPDSSLAKDVKLCLYLNVENEVTVSSRTYTATLIVTNLLARYITDCGREKCQEDFRDTIESLNNFIETMKHDQHNLNAFLKDVKFISCMGRGPSYGSALAGGLFLKEASKFPSEGTDAAEFRHGPIEVVDESFGAVVFAQEGRSIELSVKLAQDIAAKSGKVILVTGQDECIEDKNIFVLKYKKTNEYLSPILEIAGIQFLCNAVAENSGIIPGEFRWAGKITTEE